MVAARGEVGVDEIAEVVGASLETVRRDLTALQDAGVLLKVHGGAKRAPGLIEGSFYERMSQNRPGKEAIAGKLARWLQPDHMIFMDTGSTTLLAAEALADQRSLRVVTNSLKIASSLAARKLGPDVFMLGGAVEGDNSETVGSATVTEIERFNADYAIITIGALNADHGACDFSFEEAEVARAMTARANRTVILADCSKFGRRAAFRVRPLEEIDVLISDAPPGAALGAALSQAGVQIL